MHRSTNLHNKVIPFSQYHICSDEFTDGLCSIPADCAITKNIEEAVSEFGRQGMVSDEQSFANLDAIKGLYKWLPTNPPQLSTLL